MPSDTIVVVTGTFDPLELKDIELFKSSRKLGDWLVVGVHSDNYLVNNQGEIGRAHV